MTSTRTEQQAWQDFDLVQEAQAFAAGKHRNHLRKDTAIPYLSHLWAVAGLVLEHGGDDHQVAAGLLHDVVEDCGGRPVLDEVRDRFGTEVAGLVEALSDSVVDTEAGDQKQPWKPRKETYLAHLAAADDRVLLVSACDKLHNARSIVADLRQQGPALWTRFNQPDPQEHLWYYRSLVEVLQPRVPKPLGDELARTVAAMEELIAADELPHTGERI